MLHNAFMSLSGFSGTLRHHYYKCTVWFLWTIRKTCFNLFWSSPYCHHLHAVHLQDVTTITHHSFLSCCSCKQHLTLTSHSLCYSSILCVVPLLDVCDRGSPQFLFIRISKEFVTLYHPSLFSLYHTSILCSTYMCEHNSPQLPICFICKQRLTLCYRTLSLLCYSFTRTH